VTGRRPPRVLTVNTGSSSLKSALYEMAGSESRLFLARAEGVGGSQSMFHIEDATGKTLVSRRDSIPDHEAALKLYLSWIETSDFAQTLDGIGHRIVHGSAFSEPAAIDESLLAQLDQVAPLAPDHMPQALAAIRALGRAFPAVRQVACFDTAFHRTMPRQAQLYGLPRSLAGDNVVRFGFHGLSCEYVLQELRETGAGIGRGRLIIAHLGNGASITAVRDGRSIDTSMGFTPAAGMIMSTRSGDLDPGITVYLLDQKGLDAGRLNRLINQESGLLGLSGTSSQMGALLEAEPRDSRAAEAIAVFCYQAKRFLGAYYAVLGGLDTLVFTGGIGENAPSIRERICRGLDHMGIGLDEASNQANAPVISAAGSPATVRVVKTNEELVVARHTRDIIQST
jgi:acetate kinase